MTLRTVRDGARVMRFEADVIAVATSERPGVVRWSELVVYRLSSNNYIVWKIGRSVLAHRPECLRVRPDMPTWLEAGDEATVHRQACPECLPDVGDAMDPQTVLEYSRYTVLQASDPGNLYKVLGNHQVQIVADIDRQLCEADVNYGGWLRAVHP